MVVLEARGRIGGRVHSFKTDGGVTLELGAAVLTGLPGRNPLAQTCRQHGLALHRLPHRWPPHDADRPVRAPCPLRPGARPLAPHL